MVRFAPSAQTLLFLIFLVATTPPSRASSYTQWRTVVSLSHSLMTRVANLRAARGDTAGSERARLIAAQLERGLGFWRVEWSARWDYVKNYAWRDMASGDLFGALNDLSELMRSLNELTRINSDQERAAWVGRNHQSILRMSNSLFRRLLSVFRRSGPLREVVETVQIEVVDGGLLRDCLELVSNDLKGVVEVARDLMSQFSSTSHPGERDDL